MSRVSHSRRLEEEGIVLPIANGRPVSRLGVQLTLFLVGCLLCSCCSVGAYIWGRASSRDVLSAEALPTSRPTRTALPTSTPTPTQAVEPGLNPTPTPPPSPTATLAPGAPTPTPPPPHLQPSAPPPTSTPAQSPLPTPTLESSPPTGRDEGNDQDDQNDQSDQNDQNDQNDTEAPDTTTIAPTPSLTPTLTAVIPSDVRIIHVEYRPPGSELSGEHVLIENQGGDQDMTGWSLSNRHSETYFFPPGFVLKQDGSLRVWTKDGVNTEIELYWGRSDPVWDNEYDTVRLRDNSGVIVDTFSWEAD